MSLKDRVLDVRSISKYISFEWSKIEYFYLKYNVKVLSRENYFIYLILD